MKKGTVATCIVAVMFILSAMVLYSQQNQEEMQELYNESMQLNQQLQAIQQQAYEDPEISFQAEEFNNMIEELIYQADPEAEELLRKQESLEEEFYAAQSEQNSEKIAELQQEYRELDEELNPIRQKVFQREDVIQMQNELETQVLSKMQEIEPDTMNLIERLQVVQTKLNEMMGKQ